MPIGFVGSGNRNKDRLKDEGVPEAIAENEALKAIIESGHVMPGVAGFSEPAALLHKDFYGKGIGDAVMHLMLQAVLSVYRGMGVEFGGGKTLNWMFSTASADNPMSQSLIRKASGVIKFGEFTSVHGGVKKQYLLMPVVSDGLACFKKDEGVGERAEERKKVTYVVHNKESL